jgi:RimJ/RimL family protein N-acetyltransferase
MTRVVVADQQYARLFHDWFVERLPEFEAYQEGRNIYFGHIEQQDDGTRHILAVIVLNHFTKHHVEASVAADGSKRSFSREFIHVVYDYVFRQAGLVRMNVVVAAENTASINIQEHLNHKREGTLRNWFGEGKDAHIYGMTRSDFECSRWNKNNKKRSEYLGRNSR